MAEAEAVSSNVALWPELIVEGLNVAVTPTGRSEIDRATCCNFPAVMTVSTV